MERNVAAVKEMEKSENQFQDRKTGVFVYPAETPDAGVDRHFATRKTTHENENEQNSDSQMTSGKEADLQNQVFQNSIILHQIFTCFPTSFLLKRCSLVNKFWNKEARTFIRDNRKCSAYKPKSIDSGCEFLQKLDQLCCQITEDRRVIPFNSLRMPAWWRKCTNPEESSTKLESELKIKYLEISWFMPKGNGDCSIHHSLVTLLRHSAPHLKKLKLGTAAPNFEDLFIGSCFPQLEEILIRRRNYSSHEEQLADKKILGKVLESAPKCKRIRINDLHTLYLAVPQDKYGLLTELECCNALYDHEKGDENLLAKVMEDIIEKKPTLRKLFIRQPAEFDFPYDSGDEQAVVAAGIQEKEEFVFISILHRLLQTFCQTLSTVSINGRLSLEQLSSPQLLHLTKLILIDDLTLLFDIEEFWTSIVSTNFEQIVPNLDELKIIIKTVSMYTSQERLDAFSYVWPECDHIPDDNTYYVCTSVRKLSLQVEVRKIKFNRINIFFPNVKSLDLKMNFTDRLRSECLPVAEISQAWPDLEELNIQGMANFLRRNYDADFCGIHEEEAEILRSKDEDYLEAVQIVPVRPCLHTMSNLQFLRIALSFRATARNNGSTEQPLLLKSNVTDILAFIRMSQTDFSVVWEIESVDEDDDDDYGDCSDEDKDDSSDEVYEEGGSDSSEDGSEVGGEEGKGGHEETETDDDV